MFWIPTMSIPKLAHDSFPWCDVIFEIKYHVLFLYWRQLAGVFKKYWPHPWGHCSRLLWHWIIGNCSFIGPIWPSDLCAMYLNNWGLLTSWRKSTCILMLGSSKLRTSLASKLKLFVILDLLHDTEYKYSSYTCGFRKYFLLI